MVRCLPTIRAMPGLSMRLYFVQRVIFLPVPAAILRCAYGMPQVVIRCERFMVTRDGFRRWLLAPMGAYWRRQAMTSAFVYDAWAMIFKRTRPTKRLLDSNQPFCVLSFI